MFFHETHSFIDQRTQWSDFKVTTGQDVFSLEGAGSQTDGFFDRVRQFGWEMVPTVVACAPAGGTVTDAVFERVWAIFCERAQGALAQGLDGIFLELHGAMVTESLTDPEGEFLSRIRRLPGAERLPIFVVLDLHANVSPRMAVMATALVSYRENPHTDAKETSARTAELLERSLRLGLLPHTRLCQLPILWAPPGTGTADEPMRSLQKWAVEIENNHSDIWACNVAGGYSFGDTPDTGASISMVTKLSEIEVRSFLEAGGRMAWSLREQGRVQYPNADAVLASLPPAGPGPILLVEPSDNIGGGAPGDGNELLRVLVERKVANALVVINDPISVAALADVPTGGTMRIDVGGREWRSGEGALPLNVTVVSRSDGKFELEDPQSHMAAVSGRSIDMGPSSVVRYEGVTILLTSRKTAPFDLGQLHSQGLEPESFAFIGVKAAVAHRRAYDPVMQDSYYVDTPGPCSSNLDSLPWRRVRRPIWPLDANASPSFAYC